MQQLGFGVATNSCSFGPQLPASRLGAAVSVLACGACNQKFAWNVDIRLYSSKNRGRLLLSDSSLNFCLINFTTAWRRAVYTWEVCDLFL